MGGDGDDDDGENTNSHNIGEVKNELKKIYDTTEKEVKQIYAEREEAIEEAQEQYTNMLFELVEEAMVVFDTSLESVERNIAEGISRSRGAHADVGVMERTRARLLREKEERRRQIERSIEKKKSEELRKIKAKFDEQLKKSTKRANLHTASRQMKNSLRTNMSQTRRKLGGYASGTASLASLHSHLQSRKGLAATPSALPQFGFFNYANPCELSPSSPQN